MEQTEAKRYENTKLIIGLVEKLLVFIILVGFVLSPFANELSDLTAGWFNNYYVRLIIFVFIIGFAMSLLTFPFSFAAGFWLEHKYQLSNQSFGAWLFENFKSTLVGLVIFVPILLLFYFFLLNYPQSWWFWTGTLLFIVSVVLGMIAPQIIFPLFYKFEKIDDNELLERMKHLAEKGKFKLEGLYRFNMSKTTKKANAAFTGLGKSKRIILGDTLLDKFNLDELETVFAHEVGHYVHKHLLVRIAIGTITSYLTFFVAAKCYEWFITFGSYQGLADLAALPMLSIIFSLITLVFMPLTNILSRYHERQADSYAMNNSKQPDAFITALQKLSEQNLTDRSPHPLIEFLFHAHPSVEKRIAFTRKLIE